MNKLTFFRVGEVYTNDQIRFSLDLENLGGIRPSLAPDGTVRHVAVITATADSGRVLAENPYHDRIEGDILVYTARGREGDQELAGRNKRLVEQYATPTPFFGFANIGRQTYRFLGLLELLRHYQENQADRKGKLRRVWLFEFRIHDLPEIVPIEDARAVSASILAESRRAGHLDSLEREVAPLPSDNEQAAAAPAIETVRVQLFQFRPIDFEHFIRLVLEKNGFVNVSVTRATGDGGVDLDAFVDEKNEFFAGTHVQAQVKRWRHAVGSPEINSFRGALSTTAKGVFITTSHFTRAALVEARHETKPSIALVDGEKLAALIIRNRIPTDGSCAPRPDV
ncbi:MAG TPA: restriction endonuclease [Terriglobales bacterium]|nr:restriction endonuclease [Terriglobales bacterium]